jgi:hypothetical protein
MSERLVEQMVDDDVHGALFAERLWHTISETFAFDPTPQMISPALEIWGNKSKFTGRAIESQSMQRLSPSERKNVWTSETAVKLSENLDAVSWGNVTFSPVQIEHLVNGYLGWFGATVLAVVDETVTKPLSGTPKDPESKWYEHSPFKRFVRSNNPRSTKYATVFYERLKEISQVNADIRNAENERDYDHADEIEDEAGDKLWWNKHFNKAAKDMSGIRSDMKEIMTDKAMGPKEKREKIEALKKELNEIARDLAEDSNKDWD